jgi:hypothetical protein
MTRANFTDAADGLHVEELSWDDYLSLASGSLAGAKLVPLDPMYEPMKPVTLTEEPNNGRK